LADRLRNFFSISGDDFCWEIARHEGSLRLIQARRNSRTDGSQDPTEPRSRVAAIGEIQRHFLQRS